MPEALIQFAGTLGQQAVEQRGGGGPMRGRAAALVGGSGHQSEGAREPEAQAPEDDVITVCAGEGALGPARWFVGERASRGRYGPRIAVRLLRSGQVSSVSSI